MGSSSRNSRWTSSKVLLIAPTTPKPSRRSKAETEQINRQQRYLQGPSNEDPFFKPEGKSNRTKRLNDELDSLLTSIQFPKKPARDTRTVRSPSHTIMARLDPRAYLAAEKSKIHRRECMVEMNQALTQIRGSTNKSKKDKKAVSYKSEIS